MLLMMSSSSSSKRSWSLINVSPQVILPDDLSQNIEDIAKLVVVNLQSAQETQEQICADVKKMSSSVDLVATKLADQVAGFAKTQKNAQKALSELETGLRLAGSNINALATTLRDKLEGFDTYVYTMHVAVVETLEGLQKSAEALTSAGKAVEQQVTGNGYVVMAVVGTTGMLVSGFLLQLIFQRHQIHQEQLAQEQARTRVAEAQAIEAEKSATQPQDAVSNGGTANMAKADEGHRAKKINKDRRDDAQPAQQGNPFQFLHDMWKNLERSVCGRID